MQRTNIKIPDVINKSTSKNFTRVPNSVFRNTELSYKAKGLLGTLLSNNEGWCSYIKTLVKMSTDGIAGVKSGLRELEKAGYLLRIKYRDKEKKRIRGSFWIYTDVAGEFDDLEETHELLDKKGMIPDWPKHLKVENLKVENLFLENQQIENHSLKRLNSKKNNSKKNNTPDSNESEESNIRETSSNGESKKKPSPKDRNKKFIPLSKHLAKTIDEYPINYKINQKKIKSWSNDLRLLHEVDGVPVKEIKTALKWYRKNIGGEFVPEIFSGSAFRQKWIKLQAAIKRGSSKNGQPKISTAYHRKDGHQYKTNKKI